MMANLVYSWALPFPPVAREESAQGDSKDSRASPWNVSDP